MFDMTQFIRKKTCKEHHAKKLPIVSGN